MADKQKDTNDESEVFEIDRVRNLVELMKEHDLSEIDLRHASKRIRVRRGNEPAGYAMPPMMPAAPMPAPVAAPAAAAAAPAAAPAAATADDNATYIKSPMVGTFYTAPKPGAPTFVNVGDQVQADTVVCVVEAMKMFNEIPAGVSGKIEAVVAKNEEPVDVGKPLFRIIPD